MPAPKDKKRSAAIRAVGDLLRAYVTKLLKQFRPPDQLMRDVESRLSNETAPRNDASAGASEIETKSRLPS